MCIDDGRVVSNFVAQVFSAFWIRLDVAILIGKRNGKFSVTKALNISFPWMDIY